MQITALLTGTFQSPDSRYFNALMASGSLVLVAIISVITFCTIACYRRLGSYRAAFSKRTLLLYQTLINALVIELTLCSVFTMLPCLLSMVLYWAQVKYASPICLWAITLSGFHSIVSHLVCLTYIQPYRQAFERLFCKGTRHSVVSDISTLHK